MTVADKEVLFRILRVCVVMCSYKLHIAAINIVKQMVRMNRIYHEYIGNIQFWQSSPRASLCGVKYVQQMCPLFLTWISGSTSLSDPLVYPVLAFQ